jgi:hypothetical protein
MCTPGRWAVGGWGEGKVLGLSPHATSGHGWHRQVPCCFHRLMDSAGGTMPLRTCHAGFVYKRAVSLRECAIITPAWAT